MFKFKKKQLAKKVRTILHSVISQTNLIFK